MLLQVLQKLDQTAILRLGVGRPRQAARSVRRRKDVGGSIQSHLSRLLCICYSLGVNLFHSADECWTHRRISVARALA